MKTTTLSIILTFLVFQTVVFADMQRGLSNYEEILKGNKKLENLSHDELMEVLIIHNNVKSNKTSSSYGRKEYRIEVAHNDELFIINGEKFKAQTYCLGWYEGESVVFLEGSAYGACTTAKLLNTYRDEVCDVWCE